VTDDISSSSTPEAGDRELAEELRTARPVPGVGFRGSLHRHLAELDPGYGPRPERLRLLVACYIGAGGLLIALAALGLS
jgi:hypothetical protein